MQREAIARLHGDFLGPSSQPEKREELSPTITFHNPKAKEFFVDGRTLPDGKIDTIHPSSLCLLLTRSSSAVEFDVGPSWSGLMPISGQANETRKLFFWCVVCGFVALGVYGVVVQVLADE